MEGEKPENMERAYEAKFCVRFITKLFSKLLSTGVPSFFSNYTIFI